MTAMIEQRSGDVDVLEMQMRKLGIVPSEVSTPMKKGKSFGLESGKKDKAERRERKFNEERIRQLVDLKQRRRKVMDQIRVSVERNMAT